MKTLFIAIRIFGYLRQEVSKWREEGVFVNNFFKQPFLRTKMPEQGNLCNPSLPGYILCCSLEIAFLRYQLEGRLKESFVSVEFHCPTSISLRRTPIRLFKSRIATCRSMVLLASDSWAATRVELASITSTLVAMP